MDELVVVSGKRSTGKTSLVGALAALVQDQGFAAPTWRESGVREMAPPEKKMSMECALCDYTASGKFRGISARNATGFALSSKTVWE